MPNIAPEKTPRPESSSESDATVGVLATPSTPPRFVGEVGAPSPPEAWHPYSDPPSWWRTPTAFRSWALSLHHETQEDNPIFIKSIRRRYVKRPRRLSPWAGDLVVGAIFAILTLVGIAVIWKIQFKGLPPQLWRYGLLVVTGIYLLTSLSSGTTLVSRANRFLASSDKGMVWGDLIMTPVREDHFFWAWFWAPLIERLRHVALAVLATIPGILLASPRLGGRFQWGSSQFEVVYFVPLLFLAAAAVGLVALLGLLISLGVLFLGLLQSLNLGPRLYDLLGVVAGLFPVVLLVHAFTCFITACGFLSAGVLDRHNAVYLTVASLFALAGMLFAVWADWMLFHSLSPRFWDALVERCSVRGQKSWWRSLMGKD